MPAGQLYDTVGRTYAATRCTEPRIAARIWAALGDARTVLTPERLATPVTFLVPRELFGCPAYAPSWISIWLVMLSTPSKPAAASSAAAR